MMCTRCNNIGLSVLFRCIDCKAENVSDCDMCNTCRAEHIEANWGNNTRFIEVFTQ